MQEAKADRCGAEPQSAQTGEVARVKEYLDTRAPMAGLDPHVIHQACGIDLTIGDLRALLADLHNKTLALEKINSIENKMYGEDWEEIDHARLIASCALAGSDVSAIAPLEGDNDEWL